MRSYKLFLNRYSRFFYVLAIVLMGASLIINSFIDLKRLEIVVREESSSSDGVLILRP
jgi:hypothetical protein